MGDNRKLDEIAARQYGCFNVPQLRSVGFDRSAVARRVANGAWHRLAPGVYALASAPPTWERQASAAVLSRPRAIVGGAAAASLHGMTGFRAPRPVIIVPRTGNARSPIARVIRSAFFKTLETERIRGFKTTTAGETLLTLASDLVAKRLSDLVDECFLTGKVTLSEIDRIYDRIIGARVPGSARLRRVIEARHGELYEADSTYLERLLERVLSDPRIPPAVREFPMTINGSPSRVDALIEAWDLVVEADSRRWHARLEDFEADRARDNALAAVGYQVLRFTYAMLKDDPNGCVETIVAAGEHRRARRVT